jgi:ferritin-like metal-binding protein YciE
VRQEAREFIFVMPDPTSPKDLLVEELKDLYSAESQLIRALPDMAQAAECEELKSAFEAHLQETRIHAQRLEEIMGQLDETPEGTRCKVMENLVAESKEIVAEEVDPAILDLALIDTAQRVEQYEIAAYGCACALAELAGESHVARTLQTTLEEVDRTDRTLTEIAMGLNLQATAEEPGEAG